MRIVVVEPNGTGGLAHFAHQLCDALAAAGAEVVLVAGRDYELADRPRAFTLDPALRLWPIHGDGNAARRTPARRLARAARRAVRAARFALAWQGLVGRVRAHRPDVVLFGIIHFPFQWVYLEQLRRAGVPLVQICHEFEGRDGEEGGGALAGIRRRMFARVHRAFAAALFLSRDTRAAFLARFPDRAGTAHVIPHGTQDLFAADPAVADRLRAGYGLAPGVRTILFFGTVRPSKGLPDLIDAYALLPDRAGTRLVIAGFPNKHADIAALERRIADRGVADRVVLDLRYLPNAEMGALVGLGDVVVFPYRNATQSGALYLAYAFARPVVATRVGGLAEDVADGVTGLLVPPEDPPALSRALARLLADPGLAARLGAAGRDRAARGHSWAAVAAAVLGVVAPLAVPGGVSAGRRAGW